MYISNGQHVSSTYGLQHKQIKKPSNALRAECKNHIRLRNLCVVNGE